MGNAGFIPSTVWIPSRAQGLGASGLESSEAAGGGGGVITSHSFQVFI